MGPEWPKSCVRTMYTAPITIRAELDIHLDGWPLRNDDFSGGKKLAGALNFEFTEIFYEMKMKKKMLQCFLGGCFIN